MSSWSFTKVILRCAVSKTSTPKFVSLACMFRPHMSNFRKDKYQTGLPNWKRSAGHKSSYLLQSVGTFKHYTLIPNPTAILIKYVTVYWIAPSPFGRYLDEQDNQYNQDNIAITLSFVLFSIYAALPPRTHHCVQSWLLSLAWKHELIQKRSQSGTTPSQINTLPVWMFSAQSGMFYRKSGWDRTDVIQV